MGRWYTAQPKKNVKVGTDLLGFFGGHLKGCRSGHNLLFEHIYHGLGVLIFQKWAIERVVERVVRF